MNAEEKRLEYLFEKYFHKGANAEERMELADAIEKSSGNEKLIQLITDTWATYESTEGLVSAEKANLILERILGKSSGENVSSIQQPLRNIFWRRIAVAVSIILLLGTGTWLIFFKGSSKQEIAKTTEPVKQDVQPGRDGAILTLADGSKLVLDDLQNGKVTEIAEKKGNQLSYTDAEATTTVQYNTMSTPKGRQFTLVLADGSKVLLNAASSITYPTSFTGNDRHVNITGEIYFEVAKDANKPFIVSVNGIDIRVLGTHFNVNAYNDEAIIKTTLLEGSVKLSNGTSSSLLKPGWQAQLDKDGEIKLIANADLDQAVAWKNGLFSFKNADLQTIMRQVARWYNVDIEFEGTVPKVEFSGEIGRQLTLDQLFAVLDETRIHYRIDGKRLIIIP